METSLKANFAQIFSICPKILSCPKFGGAAAPLVAPGPHAYVNRQQTEWNILHKLSPPYLPKSACGSMPLEPAETRPRSNFPT